MGAHKLSLTTLRNELRKLAVEYKKSSDEFLVEPNPHTDTRQLPMCDAPSGSPEWHASLAARLFGSWVPAGDLRRAHLDARAELVRIVCTPKRGGSEERLQKAIAHMSAHFEALSAIEEHARELDAGSDSAQVLTVLAHDLARTPSGLNHLGRVVLVFCAKYRRLGVEDADTLVCDEHMLETMLAGIVQSWTKIPASTMIALPHAPMSTLPKESGDLGALLANKDAQWREAGVKYAPETHPQEHHVLVYNQAMIVNQKDNSIKESPSYMRVPISKIEAGEDPAEALTKALIRMYETTLGKSPGASHLAGLTNDIPRVVAGMFLLAREDEHSSLKLAPGSLLDTENARRLTQSIGLDASQKRNRDRVRVVREMLEHIELTRTIYGETKDDRIEWTGPIIQRLRDRVSKSKSLPDGLERARTELGVWMIAPELWRLRDAQGTTPSFMLIDKRAFELSSKTSEPFNLYWAIVQRAYNACKTSHVHAKFDDEGVFSLTFELLYKWSNIASASDVKNPGRLVSRLKTHLDLLVEHDLIVSYDETFFGARTVSHSEYRRSRIPIKLPPSLLRYLAPASFRSGRNPFAYASSDRPELIDAREQLALV